MSEKYVAYIRDKFVEALANNMIAVDYADAATHEERLQALTDARVIDGVFAAGDVRYGQSVKRITGAVFDGVCAIQSVHRYLAGRDA